MKAVKRKTQTSTQKKTAGRDSFYERLDFYRLLEAGQTDVDRIAAALDMDIRRLKLWKRRYDSQRGPFGVQGGGETAVRTTATDRKEILEAMRRVALEGNVPAAKVLLTEYVAPPATEGQEVLTIEKAVELLREWFGEPAPPI